MREFGTHRLLNAVRGEVLGRLIPLNGEAVEKQRTGAGAARRSPRSRAPPARPSVQFDPRAVRRRAYSRLMASCPIARVTRIIDQMPAAFDVHAADCGDRVLGVAVHPDDFDELSIVELWGLPVLAWDEVSRGTLHLLCEAEGYLVPPVETVEDLLNYCAFQLRPPAQEDPAAA